MRGSRMSWDARTCASTSAGDHSSGRVLSTESASSSLESAAANRAGAAASLESTWSICSLVAKLEKSLIFLFQFWRSAPKLEKKYLSTAHLQAARKNGRRAVRYRAKLQRFAFGAVWQAPQPPLLWPRYPLDRTPELGRAAL